MTAEPRRYTANEKRRRANKGSKKAKRWYRAYKARMEAGLEHCRACGFRRWLTFDHIIPVVNGGRFLLDNLTILCEHCNRGRGDITSALLSLAEEEAKAPPERRWSLLPEEQWLREREA